jgi:hypothetical protein
MTRDELDSLESGDIVIDELYGFRWVFNLRLSKSYHSMYAFNVEHSGHYVELCIDCDAERLGHLVLEASCQAAKAFDSDLKELIEGDE